MIEKLLIFLLIFRIISANLSQEAHPNIILMHIRNLHWTDLGIHANLKDSENATPNIDYLAYSGIILNRFYANGGIDSLFSGCYQRNSHYANKNLMTFYFEQNGYKVDFIAHKSYDKIEIFEQEILGAISRDNEPFLLVGDFGSLDDIKIPFVDEIVGSTITKAHKVGVMNNTIVLFISLPDNNESPLEIDIRRTAFFYSPSLKLQRRVSNQIVHVIDLLPTLVNASNLKWRTKERIYVDGINQWYALNTNDEERLDVYGENFYISNYWKLTFGESNGLYGSVKNEDMEKDKDMMNFDFEAYIDSIVASELYSTLERVLPQKIMFLRSRAKVHCNLKDFDEFAIKNIKCSRSNPCLFNLLRDPCEFDNKKDPEYDTRRNLMKEILDRFSRGESIDDITYKDTSEKAENEQQDGTIVGIILGALVLAGISVFVIVACVKEKCNRRRSVYHAKVKKKKENQKDNLEENSKTPNKKEENSISIISSNVK